MSQRVDYHWAQQELIPFLQSVFEWRLGNPGRTKAQWEADIRRAEGRINTVRDYDDSIITIDRIRLAFANPSALTAADRVQTDTIIDDLDLCLTLFVRRAINHGAYRLCSLASGLNPAAMQEREILRQKGEKVPDIRRDLASANRGRGRTYTRRGSTPVNPIHLFQASPGDSGFYGNTTASASGFQEQATRAIPIGSDRVVVQDGGGGYPQNYGQWVLDQRTGQYVMGANMARLSSPQPGPVDEYDVVQGVKALSLRGQRIGSKRAIRSTLRADAPEFVPGRLSHPIRTLH